METQTCKTCGAEIDALAVFPGGICLDCYARTPEANRPITAGELARMWGADAGSASLTTVALVALFALPAVVFVWFVALLAGSVAGMVA